MRNSLVWLKFENEYISIHYKRIISGSSNRNRYNNDSKKKSSTSREINSHDSKNTVHQRENTVEKENFFLTRERKIHKS